eukprot:scaffold684_cov345-Pavlova_lutheri.AAC.61
MARHRCSICASMELHKSQHRRRSLLGVRNNQNAEVEVDGRVPDTHLLVGSELPNLSIRGKCALRARSEGIHELPTVCDEE